jgi:hypothetical protein
MTNWKADPTVQDATARYENSRRQWAKHYPLSPRPLIGEQELLTRDAAQMQVDFNVLLAAVASSGSPPSPQETWSAEDQAVIYHAANTIYGEWVKEDYDPDNIPPRTNDETDERWAPRLHASLVAIARRMASSGSTGDRLEGAPSTRRLLDQSVDGAGSTGAPATVDWREVLRLVGGEMRFANEDSRFVQVPDGESDEGSTVMGSDAFQAIVRNTAKALRLSAPLAQPTPTAPLTVPMIDDLIRERVAEVVDHAGGVWMWNDPQGQPFYVPDTFLLAALDVTDDETPELSASSAAPLAQPTPEETP